MRPHAVMMRNRRNGGDELMSEQRTISGTEGRAVWFSLASASKVLARIARLLEMSKYEGPGAGVGL